MRIRNQYSENERELVDNCLIANLQKELKHHKNEYYKLEMQYFALIN